jgi:aminopeptidase-like protein
MSGLSDDAGSRMFAFIEELYPICRSITGDGVRETLRLIGDRIPLEIHEVPTGTPVFDWEVPKEWNIRDAYVMNARGEKVINFADSNLHVINYSVPVRKVMPLSELKKHLFSLPEHPDWIPYRTSFYNQNWGFCLTHGRLTSLEEGDYEVVIDSSLSDGSLTYGEFFLPGELEDEIHLFTHICHPSICNDNLSGIAVLTELGLRLASQQRRYSYRLVFAPTTIGSLTWLSRNEHLLPRTRAGLILAMLGDPGSLTYKTSRRGDTEIDRVTNLVLQQSGRKFETLPFSPFGTDERQYCSPGIDLPMGRLTRTSDGDYPEYHTSADNLDFIDPGSLDDSFRVCAEIIDVLEGNQRYIGTVQKGEPQLFRRGIKQKFGGINESDLATARLWVLSLSDNDHSLLDIAEHCGLNFRLIEAAATELKSVGLLVESP